MGGPMKKPIKKSGKAKSLPLPRMDYEAEKELLSILKDRQDS